jgi:hypothetical protein
MTTDGVVDAEVDVVVDAAIDSVVDAVVYITSLSAVSMPSTVS